MRTDFTTFLVFTILFKSFILRVMLVQALAYWPIFSTAANGGMFFSSHVTGQSHNPARGCRLTRKKFLFLMVIIYPNIKTPIREFFVFYKKRISIFEINFKFIKICFINDYFTIDSNALCTFLYWSPGTFLHSKTISSFAIKRGVCFFVLISFKHIKQ